MVKLRVLAVGVTVLASASQVAGKTQTEGLAAGPMPAGLSETGPDEASVSDERLGEAERSAPEVPAEEQVSPNTAPNPSVEVGPEHARAASRFTHWPVLAAAERRKLELSGDVTHPQLVRHLVIHYQGAVSSGFSRVVMQRQAGQGYVGTIPAADVKPGVLSYYIQLERQDGSAEDIFASAEAPHRVQVQTDRSSLIEEQLDHLVGGRRRVGKVSFDFVRFGVPAPAAGHRAVADEYWRGEAEYRYRLFRRVSEFGLRVGLLRGAAPVDVPGSLGVASGRVGLNYVSPIVQLRVSDWARVEGSALLGVTEVGFAVGGGTEVQLGDPFGTQVVGGMSVIQDFGTRAYFQLEAMAHPRLKISPQVEATTQPAALWMGVRLIGEAEYRFSKVLDLALRGGYQARGVSGGGVSVGSTVGYAF